MQSEAKWWRERAELADDMVYDFLGHGSDGVSLLDDLHREQEGAKAATRQYQEYWARRQRLRTPFAELRADPGQWAAVQRDMAEGRARIAQAAILTAQWLEIGLIPMALASGASRRASTSSWTGEAQVEQEYNTHEPSNAHNSATG